ncbi:choline-phosphate cytidylyltransferase [Tieghemiomyces parasiticus]|uniref:choline-phosphate cytidylyltransferase n=1 Tax=Tieghemiomyces parasiticus TaxID=78921 RepID=A0A9W8AA87_9FUNG|nr:choline-phosphate cytidylyltransferase [Tieghemiomyces parasiticus]
MSQSPKSPQSPPAIEVQPDAALARPVAKPVVRLDEPVPNPTYALPPHGAFHINPPPRDRPVRIYCDGIYDLFHFGHAKALEQAKKVFPSVYLIVGVCSDYETHRRKGKTVLTDLERYESVRHCRWVDEVIENAPWIVTQDFLDEHRIDYVAHDDIPYVSVEGDDVYAFVKAQGRFLPTQRTEGISTSDLITRIVRDYDSYLRRNLERGISHKELNVSFLKAQEIQVKKRARDIRNSIRENLTGTREELLAELDDLKYEINRTFSFWEERRQEFIRGFIGLFGTDNVVTKFFKNNRSISFGSRSSSSASLRDRMQSDSGSRSGSSADEPRSASDIVEDDDDEEEESGTSGSDGH